MVWRCVVAGEFEDWASAQGPSLVRLAFFLTGDPARAQDMVQDALVGVFVRWSRLRDPSTYARRIVINSHRGWWRRLRRRERADHLPGAADLVADPAIEVAARDEVLKALATLPPGQRRV